VGFLRGLRGGGDGDLAIDLGTANTVVYRRGRGVVVFEPSVVAIDERTGAVQAIGTAAKRMIGRTPAAIRAIRPLRHGVIADYDVAEEMLRYFIGLGRERRFASPRVVICVPSGVTDVERRAVIEAALAAGARRAYLIEEPMAGAIGAGLPVAEARGTMVVDIGGGTSEMAVISLGGMVVSQSLRVGGYELDDAIIRHVRDEHRLQIGPERAEQVKIEIGSAAPHTSGSTANVAGRDLTSGLLKRIALSGNEVQRALERPLAQIVDAVKAALDQTPPELAADISDNGLVLLGGGALLPGIDDRLRHETHVPVHVAESPLTCVAVGAGHSLEEWPTVERAGVTVDAGPRATRPLFRRSRPRNRRRWSR
jgi:rod shape-determining protein MreB